MSKKINVRKMKRAAQEARQARRVINGIFIGLIALMVLTLMGYYLWQG